METTENGTTIVGEDVAVGGKSTNGLLPPPPPPTTTSAATIPSPPTSCTPSNTGEEKKKRHFVIQEIISTELTYVERLRITLEHFLKPLLEEKILNQIELNEQFDILSKIYELHQRHCISGSISQNLTFCDLFEDMSCNLNLYSDYLANYEPAMQQRAKLLTNNRKFANFVNDKEKDPIVQNLNLESLLILPVQRIPRYRLLLEQLLKYTEEEHPDYSTVKQALDKICALAHYNNEAIRKRENKNKMMSIMMQIEPTTRVDFLAENQRGFVKEGSLQKQCRKRHKDFQFWLFSDQLAYGEMTPLGLYRLNRQIPLLKCKLTPLDDSDKEKGFIIQSPAKSFIIKASGESECKEWSKAIQEAIDKEKQSKVNAGGINEETAPLWIPDDKSNECYKCQKTFNILFRRHHCRNCGKVVCMNCSSRRFFLRHVDLKKAVRVCDMCHDYLMKPSESGKQSSPSAIAVPENINSTENNPDESDDDDDDDDYDASRGERVSVDENDLEDFNSYLDNKSPSTPVANASVTTTNPVAATSSASGSVTPKRKSVLDNLSSQFSLFGLKTSAKQNEANDTNNTDAQPPTSGDSPVPSTGQRKPRRTNILLKNDPSLQQLQKQHSADNDSSDVQSP